MEADHCLFAEHTIVLIVPPSVKVKPTWLEYEATSPTPSPGYAKYVSLITSRRGHCRTKGPVMYI
jgi:hypothetical protein